MWQVQETIVHRLGRAIRGMNGRVLEEPLPERWVELIHRLIELDRQRTRSDSLSSADDGADK